jgi:hypothetical protein
MNQDVIELNECLKAITATNMNIHSPLGYCTVYGGTRIRIDITVPCNKTQESVYEHEVTHRGDIANTHFGNIINLIWMAKNNIHSFDKANSNKIINMFNIVNKLSFKTCLEGHASFNQKVILNHLSEKSWEKALRSLSDKSYYNGYCLCKDIMGHFNIKKEAILSLSDVILILPLCLDWYDKFFNIDSAYQLIYSLNHGDQPDARLELLSNCLKSLNKTNPDIIHKFVIEINNNIDKIIQQAYNAPFLEGTSIKGKHTITSTIYPTGRYLFDYLLKMVNVFLKDPLANLGFIFGNPDNVDNINDIVDAWNIQTKSGVSVIAKFIKSTTDYAKHLNISYGPIEKYRTVSPTNKCNLEKNIFNFLQENPESLIIARYHHVTEKTGWNASSILVIPYGAWYLVISLCEYKDLGTPNKPLISPGLKGLRQFYQFYCVLNDAQEVINRIPVYLPKVLWLFNTLTEFEYPYGSRLRIEFEKILEYHKKYLNIESQIYSILYHNDLGSIIECLKGNKIHSINYDDSSELWRLFLVYGPQNYAFIIPKMRSHHILFEEKIQQIIPIKIVPVTNTTTEIRYLLEWLCSGEGF